jgi:hypothetical protein
MKLDAIALLLIGLSAAVLTLIALWIREELILWRSTRHHREQDGRARGKTFL